MNPLPVVVVTCDHDSPVNIDVVKSRLENQAEIRVVPLPNKKLSPPEEDKFIEKMKDVVIIFQRPGFITRRIVEACPRLKFVVAHGAGVDKIDLKACQDHGVWVGNLPGSNANAVAEQVIGGLIALLRRLTHANTSLHRGGWKTGRFVGRELSACVLGIIGLGNVGRRLAKIASGFGTKIIYYDPYIDPKMKSEIQGSPCDTLEELFRRSDIISVHVPLTKGTTKFISHKEFKLMKNESVLVNTSRGGVIDEKALCTALKEGIIGGAVLDVFAVEPLPKDSPLRRLSNVIITPHIGGSTKECFKRIAEEACDEILLVLSGQPPKNIVRISGKGMDLASRA